MRTRRIAAPLLLVAVAAALGEASILRRPDQWLTAEFLFHDAGYSLLIAREVLHGARLYADVAYQYGPLPVAVYCAYAWLAGNTPFAYLQFLLAFSLLAIALFYALARRALQPGAA